MVKITLISQNHSENTYNQSESISIEQKIQLKV